VPTSPSDASSAHNSVSANPTTRGITSPARSTTTQDPTFKFFRAMSGKLCSVALAIVAPRDKQKKVSVLYIAMYG
jgi:hypothetical protein